MSGLHDGIRHGAFKRAVSVGTEDILPENQELLNAVKKEVDDERRKSMIGSSSVAEEEIEHDGDGDLRMESLKEVEKETEMHSGEAAEDGSGFFEAASPVGELGSGEAEGSGEKKSICEASSGAAEKMVKGDLGGSAGKGAGSSLKTELAVGAAEKTDGKALEKKKAPGAVKKAFKRVGALIRAVKKSTDADGPVRAGKKDHAPAKEGAAVSEGDRGVRAEQLGSGEEKSGSGDLAVKKVGEAGGGCTTGDGIGASLKEVAIREKTAGEDLEKEAVGAEDDAGRSEPEQLKDGALRSEGGVSSLKKKLALGEPGKNFDPITFPMLRDRAQQLHVRRNTVHILPDDQQLLVVANEEVADERRKSMMLGTEEDNEQDGDGDFRMESLKVFDEETEMDSVEAAKDGHGILEAASPVGELGSGKAESSGEEKSASSGAAKKNPAPGNSSKEGAAVSEGDVGAPAVQLKPGETGKASGEAVKKMEAEAHVGGLVGTGDGNASSSVYFVSFEDRPEATAQQWKLARTIWRAQEEKREMPYKKLSDEGKRDFFFRSVQEKVAADLLVEQDEEPEDDDDGRHAAEMAAVAANVAQKRKEFYELVRQIIAGEVVQDNASEHSDDDGDADTDDSVAGH